MKFPSKVTPYKESIIEKFPVVLGKLEKKDMGSLVYSEYDEKFPIIAWMLLIVLIVEVCIFDKKNRLFRNVRIFKR